MATYKVIQDIEAEDKLVGPLSLRQFIYAGIAAVCLYLSFLMVTKGAAFMLVLTLPVAGFTGFFAFPWKGDQPTEVWALAKLRFMLKPRKRIWDQSGAKQLVTITAPKKVERVLTKDLDQDEVQSRLSALASTIDSRGWVAKNANINLANSVTAADMSDRLVSAASLPQVVSDVDVQAADDILDETANPVAQNFDRMVDAAEAAHRQQLINQMQQPAAAMPSTVATAAPTPAPTGPANYWFMQPTPTTTPQASVVDAAAATTAIPQAATPTPEEEALVEKFKAENNSQSVAYGHLKTIKTPEQLAAETAAAAAEVATRQVATPEKQAVIMNLANDDDKDIATLARQAQEAQGEQDGEVVISLH